ncbi:MAG: peptidylprolyl isomerase [Bacteroidota bacterium]
MIRFIGILIAIMCLSNLQAQRKVIDKVIGVVGSEYIQLSDVEEQYALSASQSGGLPPEARCQIMNQLLSQRLLLNQAKLDSVEVADAEVEVQLNARIDRILGMMGGNIQQFEEYYGQSINDVKDEFRQDLKNQIVTDRMRSTIIQGVSVTPSDVTAFFDRIPKDSLPYFNSEVEVGEIVMVPKVNDEQRNIAIEKLENIKEQIMGGADFAAMAQKYSDDPGSGRQGGDLGWTGRGKFVPEFEAAAYSLEIDELSEIVESQFGFHLIQLLGRRGNTINTRHILVRPLITDADLELTRLKLDTVRQLLQTDSISFSLAVKRYSDEDTQSYNNDGRMVNPISGNTFFEVGDLDPDVYFTIDTMDIDEYSAPFEFLSPAGETSYRIVQLQSRTAPHVASLKQDYSKIRQAAIDSKKNEYISEWLEEKVDATYVRIDPLFKVCPSLDIWRKEEIRP